MASLLICVHKIQESNTSRPLMEIRTSGGKKKSQGLFVLISFELSVDVCAIYT